MNRSRIIIFDGCCHLCTALVHCITRQDRKARFKFVPAQSATGVKFQSRLGLNAIDSQTLILIKNGRAYLRGDAALEIARDLSGIWKLGTILSIIPRGLRDRLYMFVAVRRYRWWGRKADCPIPGGVGRHRRPDPDAT